MDTHAQEELEVMVDDYGMDAVLDVLGDFAEHYKQAELARMIRRAAEYASTLNVG